MNKFHAKLFFMRVVKRNHSSSFIFILLFLYPFFVQAELTEKKSEEDISSDSTHISPTLSPFSPPLISEQPTLPFKFQPYLDYPASSLYFGSPDIEGYAYVPNSSPRAGLTLGVKRFEISYASNLPLPPEEVIRRGQTRQSTFIFQSRFRSFAFEVYS